MKQNMGKVDQALRVVIGLALVILAVAGYIGAWGYIGLIPLATGLMNFCPLYRLLGISTRRDKPATP